MSTEPSESKDARGEADVEAVDTGAPPEVLALPAWVRRVAALAAIVIGWGFIAWHNHFYVTPAVIILAIGWGASISTLYLMWRVGAAGAVPAQARESWWLEADQREDLEREKRSLLKTIREIEFDQQTGKLSERDAQEMAQVVRIRAIEVMKALDAAEAASEEGGARADIEREVRARLQVEKARKAGASKKAKGKEPAKAGKAAAKDKAKPEAKSDAKSEAKSDASAEDDSASAKARSATASNAGGAADPAEAAPLSADDSDDAEAAGADSDASSDEAPAVRDSDETAEASAKAADGDDIATLATSDAEAAPSGSKSSEVSA